MTPIKTILHEAEPVSIQSQEIHEAEIEASDWFNSNLLELSKTYGATIVGFEEEAKALLMKLDRRKNLLAEQEAGVQVEGTKSKAPRNRGLSKHELRNLESDLNEEVEGVRGKGKVLSLTLNEDKYMLMEC